METLDIDMILGAVQLTQYSSVLRDKNVPFDAFVNMNETDMVIVGITNKEHRKTLIKVLSSLKDDKMYKDITSPEPFDVKMCVDNIKFQLRILHGSILAVRKQLDKDEGKIENLMCDPTMSFASLVHVVSGKCLDSLALIENDLKALQKGRRKNYVKWSILGGIISVGAVSAYILMKNS